MEKINQQELSLAFKPKEHLTTSPQLPQSSESAIEYLRAMGAPQWTIRVLQMAQDKRHDLAPHTLRYWTEKLKDIPDWLVCRALSERSYPFFPSVDEVLKSVEEIRETLHQQSGENSFAVYRAEQKRAERQGLLASDQDYAWMRQRMREIFGDPTVQQKGKTA